MIKPLFAAAAVAVAVTAARPPLTPEQTLDRRSIGELAFSPDGARLAFTVTEPPKGASRQRNIWILDVATRRVRQLTFSEKSDSSPRWSPDGRSLAFISDRGEAAQLYLLPLAGGEAGKLVDRKDPVSAFRWSPDGGRIALLMPDPKPDAQEKREKDKDDSHVADKDKRWPRIWTVDVASRSLVRTTSAPWRISQIEWLPDGSRLIAVAATKPEADRWSERIVSIDARSGTAMDISAPRGPVGALAVSPDGKAVAYQGARVDGPDAHDLWLQPLAGGRPTNLTAAALDRPVAAPRWVDLQTIVATAQRGFATTIISASPAATVQTVEGIESNATAFDRSKDGTIAYVGESATRAPEIWIKPPSGAAGQVTTLNEKWNDIPLVPPEFVRIKSFDGVEIETALLKPPGAERQPAPAVVLVHGGPTGRWSDAFEPWGQLLAARGYAVLYPNVRGSTAYGHRFVEMNRADWGGGDFKDVMAVVDWAVARGLADPNRLGIGGWSYGGYMAAWAVTQTDRFKAAVSGAPVIDLASEFGTEDGSAYDEWFYGTPYEKLDGFIKSSPITFVKQAKTPTLLLQGENDVTDPIGQSQQFYRGLKRYGVEAELVLYPREGHGLREEKHLVDRLARILAWYDRYLKPTS